MGRPGRPRGTGYDDGEAIAAIRRTMVDRGLSRRAAIIAVCGADQLRRIERKMARGQDVPAPSLDKSMWRQRAAAFVRGLAMALDGAAEPDGVARKLVQAADLTLHQGP